MSLESQRTELSKSCAINRTVVEIIEEAKSAKSPGRPRFTAMLDRIEAGEAEGIIAWGPDRLARNSVDGGRVIHLLDRGLLKDLKFGTCTFENNAQGKLMLSIMFGQSKYYSDALSENVKRGNRTKAENGWRPGSTPFGYANDPVTKTIAIDPFFHPFVRRMFDMVLTGGHSAREVARVARDEWQLRSPARRRGGGLIHQSMVHRLLTNPFYAGYFAWEGALVAGKHEAVVTMDEFKLVQAVIRTRSNQHPKRLGPLTFRGLLQCGACGRPVVGERKVNRYGSVYTYYHCSRGHYEPRCRQPSIREEELERQLTTWLTGVVPTSEKAEAILALIKQRDRMDLSMAASIRVSVQRALQDSRTLLGELTELRLRRLIDDEEFLVRRRSLQEQVLRLTKQLDELASPDAALEPIPVLISFSILAAKWFPKAHPDIKRSVLKIACSNPVLIDGKLNVEAAKWLSGLRNLYRCPNGLGLRDGVATFLSEMSAYLATDEGKEVIRLAQIVTREFADEDRETA